MATTSLPVPAKAEYHLPEEVRQAIISNTPGAKLAAKIAQQRNAFMAANGGDPYGLQDRTPA